MPFRLVSVELREIHTHRWMRIEKVFLLMGTASSTFFREASFCQNTEKHRKHFFCRKMFFQRNTNFLWSERSGTSEIWKLVEFHCLSSSGNVRSSKLKPNFLGVRELLRFWKIWWCIMMHCIYAQKSLKKHNNIINKYDEPLPELSKSNGSYPTSCGTIYFFGHTNFRQIWLLET